MSNPGKPGQGKVPRLRYARLGREIALRIMRALRDMGIEAAIIHGREDRLSLPVRMSDVAYANYKDNPLDSYLDIESVVAAAESTTASAESIVSDAAESTATSSVAISS